MIIKHFYLWKQNASWSEEDFVMIVTVGVSLIVSFASGMFTYWGLSIFGPWFEGSHQVWFFTWVAPFLVQFYFWGRWARFAHLKRACRLDIRTGEIIGRKWFKSSETKKREQAEMKLRERQVALGFASDIRK